MPSELERLKNENEILCENLPKGQGEYILKKDFNIGTKASWLIIRVLENDPN